MHIPKSITQNFLKTMFYGGICVYYKTTLMNFKKATPEMKQTIIFDKQQQEIKEVMLTFLCL